MQRASDGKDEEFSRTETELEKLIREVKLAERQETLERHAQSFTQAKRGKHITSHFDQSTIKVKLRAGEQHELLQESFFRNNFSAYGLVDGVTIEKGKAFVMFRYRDSALKAMREL